MDENFNQSESSKILKNIIFWLTLQKVKEKGLINYISQVGIKTCTQHNIIFTIRWNPLCISYKCRQLLILLFSSAQSDT